MAEPPPALQDTVGAPRWAIVVAGLFLGALFLAFLLLPVQALRQGLFLDFYDYYYAALSVVRGTDPYDAPAADALARAAGVPFVVGSDYIYPLPFAAALAPLTLLEPVHAAALWYLLSSVALLAACHRLVGVGLPRASAARRGAALLACVLFPPVVSTQCMGQVNNVVLWLLVVAMDRWAARRDGTAGMALGLAAAIKLFPGALLLVAAAHRRWTIVGAAALTGVGLLGASEACARGSTVRFFGTVLPGLTRYRDHHPHPGNQSFRGVMLRLFHENQWSIPYVNLPDATLGGLYGGGIGALGLLTLVVLTRSFLGQPSDERQTLQFGLVIACALLVSPLGWEATGAVLLIPMAALLRTGATLAVVAIFLLFLVQRVFDPFMIDPAAWPWLRAHPLLPNASFLSVVLCYGMCARRLWGGEEFGAGPRSARTL